MLRRESGVRVFAERTSERAGFIPACFHAMVGAQRMEHPSVGDIHVPNKLVNLIVKPRK